MCVCARARACARVILNIYVNFVCICTQCFRINIISVIFEYMPFAISQYSARIAYEIPIQIFQCMTKKYKKNFQTKTIQNDIETVNSFRVNMAAIILEKKKKLNTSLGVNVR